MNEIKISVIIPVYNAELYLRECLQSVIGQTLQEIEIICVDDGSTDASWKILKEFAAKDHRIVLLQQQNKYAGVARNAGLQVAKGKYLSFLDADDYFEESMLEHAYDRAEQEAAEIVIWNGEYFNNKNGIVTGELLNKSMLPGEKTFALKNGADTLYNMTNSATWNKLFLHQLAKRCRLEFQPVKRTNDMYFVFVAMAHATRISILDEKLMHIRTNNSKSLQGSNAEDPTHIITALVSTKERLIQDGLFEFVKKSFLNIALEDCLHILGTVAYDSEQYIKFFMYLRNQGLCKLGLLEQKEEFFYQKHQYQAMKEILFGEPLYVIYQWTKSKYEEANCYLERLSKKLQDFRETICQKIWMFPYDKVDKNSRVVLYGAGDMGKDYAMQIKATGYCELVMWVDKNCEMNEELNAPQCIMECEFDYVVIAIHNPDVRNEIKSWLFNSGIAENTVIG